MSRLVRPLLVRGLLVTEPANSLCEKTYQLKGTSINPLRKRKTCI